MVISKKQQPQKTTPPAYGNLESSIRWQINTGQLTHGQKLGSTECLARQWGVSAATVRQSLQILAARGLLVRRPGAGTFVNAPNGVDAIQEDLPEHESNQKSTSLALLVPDISRPEYAFLSRGIQDAAHENGLDVIISSTDDNPQRYQEIIERQIQANVFGLLMVPPYGSQLSIKTLYRIEQSQIPVVTCYRPLASGAWPLVCNDTYDGLYKSASHLCQIGRKRVAFVGTNRENENTFRLNHHAVLKALADHDVRVDCNLHLALTLSPCLTSVAHNRKVFSEQFENWFADHHDVDAICCSGDDVAAAVIDVLRKHHRQIPSDIALTGNGGIGEYFGLAPGELTSLDGSFYDLGKISCELLLAMREGKVFEPNHVVLLKPALRIGKSTVESIQDTSPKDG
jgi:LacI family transcriptional regulator